MLDLIPWCSENHTMYLNNILICNPKLKPNLHTNSTTSNNSAIEFNIIIGFVVLGILFCILYIFVRFHKASNSSRIYDSNFHTPPISDHYHDGVV